MLYLSVHRRSLETSNFMYLILLLRVAVTSEQIFVFMSSGVLFITISYSLSNPSSPARPSS